MKDKGTPVLIRLKAMASYEGIESVPIQLMTMGTLTKQPEKEHYIIRYRETDRDETTGETMVSDVELDLKKNRVIMNRSGDFSNTMVFARDQRFDGQYRTPYGDMDMTVYTRHLQCSVGEKEGSLYLKYQLNLQGNYASTNELHLNYLTGKGKAV